MWTDGEKAIYVPIENVVDTDMECFSFLRQNQRWQKVKSVKLRGVHSQGVLVPCDQDLELGTDMSVALNVKHDDPEAQFEKGGIPGPSDWDAPKYDIDALLKYQDWFKDGETVIVTEKIHGTNLKALYSKADDKFYVGSRSMWMPESVKCPYWTAIRNTPQVEEFCRKHPDLMIRGEAYGMQKHYKYDVEGNDYKFVAFDLMRKDRTYLDFDEFSFFTGTAMIPPVPNYGCFNFCMEAMRELADGPSALHEGTPKEGVVVKPLFERQTEKFERVILKLIGNDYNG
jgi:RNA ligase (TIGR02306 family)